MPVTHDDRDVPLPTDAQHSDETIIETLNLLEEVLTVGKRKVETGRVQISLLTETEQRQVNETLRFRHVDVQRTVVGRQLAAGEAMPQSRIEDDVLVVPVIEEVLVLEKRVVVTEELRIRIKHGEEQVQHTVPLRRQRAVVDHSRPANDDVSA